MCTNLENANMHIKTLLPNKLTNRLIYAFVSKPRRSYGIDANPGVSYRVARHAPVSKMELRVTKNVVDLLFFVLQINSC